MLALACQHFHVWKRTQGNETLGRNNPEWKQLSDDEFVELSKQFNSSEAFARHFGLSRVSFSFRQRLRASQINFVRIPKISKQDFQTAVDNASSIAEVIENLGFNRSENQRYRDMKNLSEMYQVQLPKVDTIAANQKLAKIRRIPDAEFFSFPSSRFGTALRHRMVDVGIPYNCSVSECPLSQGPAMWAGKPIVLQVDHINGNSSDNRLQNLRFLCANCHTQTDTFTNRKKSGTPKQKVCSCGRNVQSTITECPHVSATVI